MNDPLGYEGARVVVTGAASGVGAATARVLVELGAEVTAIDIAEITEPVSRSVHFDLRDRSAIEATAADLGPLDAFFSCAGVPGPPFSGGATLEPVDVMVVNFVGARHLAERAIPAMRSGAAIVFVASASGAGWQGHLETLLPLVTSLGFDAGLAWCESNRAVIDVDTYFLSKEAINAWVAWRSASLIRDAGIRLNCTNPGSIETPMMDVFRGLMPDPPCGPIGRMSTADEQAWPLVVLNSPRLGYVNGQALVVDGGLFGAATTGQPIE